MRTRSLHPPTSASIKTPIKAATILPRFATAGETSQDTLYVSSFCRGPKKFGTLHEFACHPCARGHANLLCIVPILLYVLPELHVSSIAHTTYISLTMAGFTPRVVWVITSTARNNVVAFCHGWAASQDTMLPPQCVLVLPRTREMLLKISQKHSFYPPQMLRAWLRHSWEVSSFCRSQGSRLPRVGWNISSMHVDENQSVRLLRSSLLQS